MPPSPPEVSNCYFKEPGEKLQEMDRLLFCICPGLIFPQHQELDAVKSGTADKDGLLFMNIISTQMPLYSFLAKTMLVKFITFFKITDEGGLSLGVK